MVVSGIQFHPAILVILIMEIALFSHQMMGYLARPHEKKRLWHAILIGLLIPYNIAQNLIPLPDPGLALPIRWQHVLQNMPGYFVTAYMPFYCYKVMNLRSLRWHAKYGYLVILLPALYFFFIYYPAYGSILQARRYVYILPAVYASWVLITAGRGILKFRRRKRGSRVWKEMALVLLAVLFWSVSPLLGAYLELPRWSIGVFTNISFLLLNIFLMKSAVRRYRQEYQELQDANVNLGAKVRERTLELEKAIGQKTNAYANLIHETRTPLTLINNYLDDYMNKGLKEDLFIVKENLNKVNKDINNLFDLERYSKDMVFHNSERLTDLSQQLREALPLFRCYCQKKNITMQDQVEEGLLVRCDPAPVHAIINNLVENAIKYTDQGGGIGIILKQEAGRIFFQVSDNGVGIAPALHQKIFEPYYQINHPRTNYRGGMGLGLPLVRKIVDSLKGEIRVDSDPGTRPGTTLTVYLPYTDLRGAGMVEQSGQDTGSGGWSGMAEEQLKVADTGRDEQKQTILLVEDNFSMVNYLFNLLTPAYNVLIALNGKEALMKLGTYSAYPDLIICDIMMGEMDGYGFAEKLSGDPELRHIPLIFLTARYTDGDIVRGLKLGAIDVIRKPFRTSELLPKIAAILERFAEQRKALQRAVKTMGTAALAVAPEGQEGEGGTLSWFEANCLRFCLSAREADICQLVSEGISYKAIARKLFIAEATVKKHIENIFGKVGCTNKVQLINKLMRTNPGKGARARHS